MREENRVTNNRSSLNRRSFMTIGAATVAGTAVVQTQVTRASTEGEAKVVTPPAGKRILLSCKLGMIPKESNGRTLSLADRLGMAGAAGFDGVDLDQAAECTAEQARDAVRESGVFVHNAINHAHWQKRLTSPSEEDRAQGPSEHRTLPARLPRGRREWRVDRRR